MRRALRRYWRHPYVIVVAAILLVSGGVGGTYASFVAQTGHLTSAFAGGWIGAPSGLTFTPSGYDAQLAWTPGTHGPVTGQQVYSLDNGATQSCPSTGYSLVTTLASAGTSSYTHSRSNPITTLNANINNSATSLTVASNTGWPAAPYTIEIDDEQLTVTAKSGPGSATWTVTRAVNGTTAAGHQSPAVVSEVTDPYNGHYMCEQIVSTSASSWTASATVGGQAGLVATSVVITNATSGQLKTNDTIVVTYNQKPTITTPGGGTNGVCEAWDASGNVTLYVVYQTCGNPPAIPPGWQLRITGLTNGKTAVGHGNANVTAPTVSASAPWTVTYKLSANLAQAMTPGTGTAVPDGSWVKSNATTDQAPACMSATYDCTVSATLR